MYVHQDQTGVNRYDRISGGDGLHRSGFDPQTVDFLLVRYRRQGTVGFDELSATGSINRQSDGRFEQTRPTTVLDAQRAVTTSYGYHFDGQRRVGTRHRIGMGADVYDEWIDASREQTDARTQASQSLRPDIPDGTRYTTAGVFVQDVSELIPGRLTVQGGLRYGRFSFSTAANAALGVIAEEISTEALTYDVGAVVNLTKHIHLTFAAGRGFRSANAADLGSVGLTGGGGFEIAPSTAAGFGAAVASTSASGAVSAGPPVAPLDPEIVYAYEPGLKFQSARASASIAAFDVEYLDTIQRRAAVFPTDMVGTTISGYVVVRQDSSGLAYIAEDQRPIGTRANVDRARIRGLDAQATYRFNPHWRARAYYAFANGRLSTGEYMRRMPPPLGGLLLHWGTVDDNRWLEGVATFAQEQHRLNPGDVTDARIGALRTRAAIAGYFNGTATDLGLVVAGRLTATGEDLAAVQNRVLGTGASAPSVLLTTGIRRLWRARRMAILFENRGHRDRREPDGSQLSAVRLWRRRARRERATASTLPLLSHAFCRGGREPVGDFKPRPYAKRVDAHARMVERRRRSRGGVLRHPGDRYAVDRIGAALHRNPGSARGPDVAGRGGASRHLGATHRCIHGASREAFRRCTRRRLDAAAAASECLAARAASGDEDLPHAGDLSSDRRGDGGGDAAGYVASVSRDPWGGCAGVRRARRGVRSNVS